ncbi:uncharacterized protein [Amphiura filiformis]|uniref:uncharacterized protein n=1 Tax=Amphiura filiformis TaxID=82378 RepID=UPI003B2236DB
MMAGSEPCAIDFPTPVPAPNNAVIEPWESGPDIIEHPKPSFTLDSGSHLSLRVQYANSKYPVTITWYRNNKELESQENCPRGAETTLRLFVRHTAIYKVGIVDTYNGYKTASFECCVHVNKPPSWWWCIII